MKKKKTKKHPTNQQTNKKSKVKKYIEVKRNKMLFNDFMSTPTLSAIYSS